MARRPYFSGNYGSALGSTANAANLIAQAGATQGQMYANMGNQIGGMIKQYGLNKEKQKENKSTIKSSIGILQRMSKIDEANAPQYMAQIEQLGNEDIPLSERGMLADKTLKGISITNQYRGQMLSNQEKQQALGLAKQLEASKIENAKLQNTNLGIKNDLAGLLNRKGQAVAEAEITSLLNRYNQEQELLPGETDAKRATNKLTTETAQASSELLPLRTNATRSALTASEIKSDTEVADVLNRGGPGGVANEMQRDRELSREDIKSQIKSRQITSAAQLYKSMNIGTNAPQDLEKRFDDIALQISKVDDSQIKVRNKDGDEVMVSLKDYQSNPDNFAPLVSDRLKALQSKKEALIEEQTSAALSAKIPYIDPETGETKYTTVADKLAYDQARAKKTQDERQAQIEENKAKLPNAFYGIPSSPVIGY